MNIKLLTLFIASLFFATSVSAAPTVVNLGNASSTALSAKVFCLTLDICRTTWPTAGSFAWPFTKQADNSQGTTTVISLIGGFYSSASSTLASTTISSLLVTGSASTTNFFTNNLLTFGSSTIQSLFSPSATATNLYFTNALANGSSTFQALFSPSATATNLYFTNALASGSTTLQNFTSQLASTTQLITRNASSTLLSSTIASTSQLQLSGKKDAILSVDINGWVVASSSIGNNQLQQSTISGISLGGTLAALTAGTTLTSGGTFTGATARTFDIDLTHANDWTGLQTFTNSTSTKFSSQYASTTILCVSNDCRTAWPSAGTFAWPFTKLGTNEQATSTTIEFTGANSLIATASSTLASTTLTTILGTHGTTTNFYASSNLRAGTGLRVEHEAGDTDIAVISDGSAGVNYQGILSLYCSGGNCTTSGQKIKLDSGDVSSYVNTSGNFGMGTSTPQYKFQIASAGKQLALTTTTITDNHWILSNARGTLYFATSSPTSFATSTTAAMSIDGTGNVVFSQLVTANNFLALGTSTLQNFTGQEATLANATGTNSLATVANFITVGTAANPGYIASTTAISLNIASSTLVAGASFNRASTTIQIAPWLENRQVVGASCMATTTASAAGGAIFRVGGKTNTSAALFCDGNPRTYTFTAIQVAAFSDFLNVTISTASNTADRVSINVVTQKVSK